MVANPAGGQLNRKHVFSPVPVRAREFGLARRVRPSHSAPARLFLPIPAAASIYVYRHTPSGQSRLNRVTQLRTNSVHCRESAGTGPVVLKVLRGMGVAYSGIIMTIFLLQRWHAACDHHGSSHFQVSTIFSLGLDNEQADAERDGGACLASRKFSGKNADRVEIIFPVQLVDHYIGGLPLCYQCL